MNAAPGLHKRKVRLGRHLGHDDMTVEGLAGKGHWARDDGRRRKGRLGGDGDYFVGWNVVTGTKALARKHRKLVFLVGRGGRALADWFLGLWTIALFSQGRLIRYLGRETADHLDKAKGDRALLINAIHNEAAAKLLEPGARVGLGNGR